MAKLYFRYGTVGSAKTLNLLAVAHNYRQQGKSVMLLKPAMDSRFGETQIRSRAGLEMHADVLLKSDTQLEFGDFYAMDCILVDEAQFVSPFVIDQFREITYKMDIPVLCYGLRTDYRSYLFEGAKRLLELADAIEEIKATCHYCNKKSIMNLKHSNGMAVADGPSIELGTEDKYFPACYECYINQIKKTKAETSPHGEAKTSP